MATRRLSLVLAAAITLLPSALTRAQAITDPNQIVGEVRFLVTNPAILDVLAPPPGRDEGLSGAPVSATSLVPPALTHTTGGPVLPGGLSVAFDLTVESSLAGIPYRLESTAHLDGGRDHYEFLPVTTAPVFPDPAPDVGAWLEECAGMIEVRYELDDGSPLPWSFADMTSSVEVAPGSWSTQARSWNMRQDVADARLLVRGGVSHDVFVDAHIAVGSGDTSFIVPIPCSQTVFVDCDELQPVICVFTRAQCELPPDPLGQIKGVVDAIGETELVGTTPDTTEIAAGDGPFGNGRVRHLDQPPASGPFVLPNLLPGPPAYVVGAMLDLDNGSSLEYFRPPILGHGSNPRVPVGPGEIVDLDDTFVFDLGHVTGDVLLSGVSRRNATSLLADVVHPRQGESRTAIEAVGLDESAPGATLTASGGGASVAIGGALDVTQRNWRGTYDLRLGGLDDSTTRWEAERLRVALADTDEPVPENWHRQWFEIRDLGIGTLQVEPGSTQEVDRLYCVSEVHVGYESTTGEFVRPTLRGGGTFTGTDFLGRPVNLEYSNEADGTPEHDADASNEGLVVMILPQGEWGVSPRVTSISPRGAGSDTQLPGFTFPVGCRQVIKLRSQLVPLLGDLDECATQPVDLVEGSFRSEDDVVRVQWSLNGGPLQDLCNPCGNSPSFAFPVEWQACENELFVEAEDVEGRIASVTGFVRLDDAPPVVETDRLVLWPPNHAMWCFEDLSQFVRLSDNCPEPIEWAIQSCRSNQPDDVQGGDDGPGGGDGHTVNDCQLSADGRGVCLRAERLGNCPVGRTYGVSIRAVDGCGNVTETEIELESPPAWTPGLSRDVVRPDHVVHGDVMPFPTIVDPDPDANVPQPFTCGR